MLNFYVETKKHVRIFLYTHMLHFSRSRGSVLNFPCAYKMFGEFVHFSCSRSDLSTGISETNFASKEFVRVLIKLYMYR